MIALNDVTGRVAVVGRHAPDGRRRGGGPQRRLAGGGAPGSEHLEDEVKGQPQVARSDDQERQDEEQKEFPDDVHLRVHRAPSWVEVQTKLGGATVGAVDAGRGDHSGGDEIRQAQHEAYEPDSHGDQYRYRRQRTMAATTGDNEVAFDTQHGQGGDGHSRRHGFREATQPAREVPKGPIRDGVPYGVERKTNHQHQEIASSQVDDQSVVGRA